ncbi:uncharacterized protein [Primulina eburnea]|uniref:uncharacterized protein n=1 Tax=Primulina eburnea TaxID=1245227 RepID=UPI003C6C499D
MDPDEVARLVTKLKISNLHVLGETLTLDVADLKAGKQRLESCLVAKVLSPKMINSAAFKQQMPRILQTIKHVEIGALGDNILVFDFSSISDHRRALHGGPWNFFRDLIIFEEPRGAQNPRDMSFNKISFCVQCYNLPLICMHRDVLRKVGSLIGEVEEIDTNEYGYAMGRAARMRVCIDVNKPLKKSISVSVNQDEDDVIVVLTYDKLPDFCYNCVCIGHSFRDCASKQANEGKLAYGGWLIATSHKGVTKTQRTSPGKSPTPGYEAPSNGSM